MSHCPSLLSAWRWKCNPSSSSPWKDPARGLHGRLWAGDGVTVIREPEVELLVKLPTPVTCERDREVSVSSKNVSENSPLSPCTADAQLGVVFFINFQFNF